MILLHVGIGIFNISRKNNIRTQASHLVKEETVILRTVCHRQSYLQNEEAIRNTINNAFGFSTLLSLWTLYV